MRITGLVIPLLLMLSAGIASQEPLTLVQQIALPDVEGRIDHLSVDRDQRRARSGFVRKDLALVPSKWTPSAARSRVEATEALRGLVDAIVLTPARTERSSRP
jgi:hypothetical protein